MQQTIAGAEPERLLQTAKMLRKARRVYVLGVGTLVSAANMFAASVGRLHGQRAGRFLPSEALPLEALAQAERGDVLLAMTFEPYRREALEAVAVAKRKR